VKRIVEKHGGRIWFDSELDKGTVFYVSFKKDPETSEGDIFLRS
jgi:signal transduction histidine kinase